MKMELFPKKFNVPLENSSGNMRMLSDLQLIYIVSRNSTQLLNINTTKIQVEHEPFYIIAYAGKINHRGKGQAHKKSIKT